MAKFQEADNINKVAGANLSTKQYYIVKRHTTENQVVLASAATDKILGVLQNDPLANEAAQVKTHSTRGTGKVLAGGAITAGAYLTSDSNGKAIVTTTQGNVVFGIAEEAADASTVFEYTPVYLIHP